MAVYCASPYTAILAAAAAGPQGGMQQPHPGYQAPQRALRHYCSRYSHSQPVLHAHCTALAIAHSSCIGSKPAAADKGQQGLGWQRRRQARRQPAACISILKGLAIM